MSDNGRSHSGSALSRHHKLLRKVLRGDADAAIRFSEVCALLKRLGFRVRIRGSHHVFSRHDIPELINLQIESGNAKAYQVRQVRHILQRYRIGEGELDAD